MLLQRLTRAHKHPLPLVVEVGTIIDVLKVGMEKADLSPFASIPQTIEILNRCHWRVGFDTGAWR
jgi:hypothetical protein